MNFSYPSVLSKKSLYKQRKAKQNFLEILGAEQEQIQELSKEEILKLNRVKKRYSRQQIDAFVAEHMENGSFMVTESTIQDKEAFEKLVLAYDQSIRRDSAFQTEVLEGRQIENEQFIYPEMIFRKKSKWE